MPEETIEARAYKWIRSGDTGTSSKTIWYVMMGLPWADSWGPSPPWDPDDFGRCYRLLVEFPQWRERLGEVAARYRSWGPLVREWARLTDLYEEEAPSGTAPKLYAAVKELLKEGGAR